MLISPEITKQCHLPIENLHLCKETAQSLPGHLYSQSAYKHLFSIQKASPSSIENEAENRNHERNQRDSESNIIFAI